jgi:hypothetical protein
MPDDPFRFLGDADAFVQRFVLSLVLAPPPSRRRAPSPAPRPAAPKPNQLASKKK